MSGKIDAEMVPDPELRAVLTGACEEQYRGWLYGGGVKADSKDKIADTMEEIQRQREEIERKFEEVRRQAERVRREARIMSDPHAREITENLTRKHGYSGEVCPECGRPIRNKKNGKPWCSYCDKPVKPEQSEGYTFKDLDGKVNYRG